MRRILLILILAAPAFAQTDTPTETPTPTPSPTRTPTCDLLSVVTTTASDSSYGSLLWAMGCKAAAQDRNVSFNIAGAGPHTIVPGSAIPGSIGGYVDGTTQPGTDCGDLWAGTDQTLQIVIDLSVSGFFTAPQGSGAFRWPAYGSLLQGIKFINAPATAPGATIEVAGSGAVIRCCTIENSAGGGIEEDGTFVRIGGPDAGDGNIIIGNAQYGIQSYSSYGVIIQGNFIGVKGDGTADGNGLYGIWLRGFVPNTQAYIGGLETIRKKNLISNNTQLGIRIDAGVTDATIRGNYIGVDRTNSTTMCNNIAFGGAQIDDQDTSVFDSNVIGACVPTATPTNTSAATPTVTPTPYTTGCLELDPVACLPKGVGPITCVDFAIAGQQVDAALCADVSNGAPGCCIGVIPGVPGCDPVGNLFGSCHAGGPTNTPTSTPSPTRTRVPTNTRVPFTPATSTPTRTLSPTRVPTNTRVPTPTRIPTPTRVPTL